MSKWSPYSEGDWLPYPDDFETGKHEYDTSRPWPHSSSPLFPQLQPLSPLQDFRCPSARRKSVLKRTATTMHAILFSPCRANMAFIRAYTRRSTEQVDLRTFMAQRPNPTMFYFPGLSSRPWHEPSSFSWCAEMEKNVPGIRAEYQNLVHRRKTSSDYDTGDDGGEHKLHTGKWDWHSYVLKGRRQEVFRQHCPLTASLLDDVASHMVGTPFSFSFFSTLHGGGAIAAHTAPCNLRLRCHLPLTVPSGDPEKCGMRVGGETRPWEEGKCVIFDDCYEHEVWNKTDGERVLLLFDLWHPDLAEEERHAVTDMFGYAAKQGWLKGGDEGKG